MALTAEFIDGFLLCRDGASTLYLCILPAKSMLSAWRSSIMLESSHDALADFINAENNMMKSLPLRSMSLHELYVTSA